MRFELTTSTLARWRSTTELRPRRETRARFLHGQAARARENWKEFFVSWIQARTLPTRLGSNLLNLRSSRLQGGLTGGKFDRVRLPESFHSHRRRIGTDPTHLCGRTGANGDSSVHNQGSRYDPEGEARHTARSGKPGFARGGMNARCGSPKGESRRSMMTTPMNGIEVLPPEGIFSGQQEPKQDENAEASSRERDAVTLKLSSTIAPGAWVLLPVLDLVEAKVVARRLSRDLAQARSMGARQRRDDAAPEISEAD